MTEQNAHKFPPLHTNKSNSVIIWRRSYVQNEAVIIGCIFLFAGRNWPVTGARGGGRNSHKKGAGMLVGNFLFCP